MVDFIEWSSFRSLTPVPVLLESVSFWPSYQRFSEHASLSRVFYSVCFMEKNDATSTLDPRRSTMAPSKSGIYERSQPRWARFCKVEISDTLGLKCAVNSTEDNNKRHNITRLNPTPQIFGSFVTEAGQNQRGSLLFKMRWNEGMASESGALICCQQPLKSLSQFLIVERWSTNDDRRTMIENRDVVE